MVVTERKRVIFSIVVSPHSHAPKSILEKGDITPIRYTPSRRTLNRKISISKPYRLSLLIVSIWYFYYEQ